MPERFELGTLPYELMAGTTAAVDFIASLAPAGGSRRERLLAAHHAIDEHERRLRGRLEEGIAALGDRVALHSVAADRTPTLFLTFSDRDAADAYRSFADRDILAPADRSTPTSRSGPSAWTSTADCASGSPPTTTTTRSTGWSTRSPSSSA